MMDDEEVYDEFGNLIGDPFDSDAESSEEQRFIDAGDVAKQGEDEEDEEDDGAFTKFEDKPAVEHNELVSYEEGKGGMTLSEVYGSEVETKLATSASAMVDEPVIKPKVEKKLKIDFTEKVREAAEDGSDTKDAKEGSDFENFPKLVYSRKYMISLINTLPERVRNAAVIGDFHSGKTTFFDMLVLQTHAPSIFLSTNLKTFKPLRFMDNHKLEIDRGLSIKSSPITLLLPDRRGKSYVFNLIDTPGHFNFSDETLAALGAVDGAVMVIDIVEGLTARAKTLINEVLRLNLPITFVLNKIDRLILELRLPVADFYNKIKYVLDDINAFIERCEYTPQYEYYKPIDPRSDNVIFAASGLEFCFGLADFCTFYSKLNDSLDPFEFKNMLWGDVHYNALENTFLHENSNGKHKRSFNAFIAEPLYKLFTYTLTVDTSNSDLDDLLWKYFSISLDKNLYKLDPQILLKSVLKHVFPNACGFVNSVVELFPLPDSRSKKIMHTQLGYKTLKDDIIVGKIVKSVERADGKGFYSLLRIFNGTIKLNSTIKVLGNNFNDDNEDFNLETVDELYIPGGRYRIPVREAHPGSIILVSGIDSIISKEGTVHSPSVANDELKTFEPTNFEQKSFFKVSIEPANPSELPKLIDGFRKLNKSYLACMVKVEESGEHILLGPGELYMDCMLHDLRVFFTDDLEIKVSDPSTRFSETCIESSAVKISTRSQSNHNSISIMAEPLNDPSLSKAIEDGRINLSQPVKVTSKLLRTEFGWDALSARSLWCFGPNDLLLPSMLLDDTIEGETDKKLLYSVKDSVNLGFKWSANEGPLCDEPIRNTKFKILDAILSGSAIQRSGTQIISMTRKACYSGFLTATPRLLEPIYVAYITCTSVAIFAVKKLLYKRRGYLIDERAIPGTHLHELEGNIPVIDSVGFESDVRLQTQGQAMCYLVFDKWDVVPGDPLDRDCFLPPLKPVPTESLARDFMMKTRKRKGLSGEPNLQKYIDPELYKKLEENGLIL